MQDKATRKKERLTNGLQAINQPFTIWSLFPIILLGS